MGLCSSGASRPAPTALPAAPPTGFNEAAVLRPRKVLAHFPAGLDRRVPRPHWKRFNEAAVLRPADRPASAARPRPRSGRARTRRANRRFNEAAVLRPRKAIATSASRSPTIPHASPRDAGRGLALEPAPDRRARGRRGPPARPARWPTGPARVPSMQAAVLRPRQGWRRLGCAQILARASMRPRSCDRGTARPAARRPRLQLALPRLRRPLAGPRPDRAASMRPRSCDRGRARPLQAVARLPAGHARPAAGRGFNEAAGLATALQGARRWLHGGVGGRLAFWLQ